MKPLHLYLFSLLSFLAAATTVHAQVPEITSANIAASDVGVAFNYVITTDNAAIGYSAQNLPAGLTRTGDTISGFPTNVGVTNVTLQAFNGNGSGSPFNLEITINPVAPVITSTLTATGNENEPFTYQITADNDPTSFSALGLSSITGLSIDTGTGVISGTPTVTGSFDIGIQAGNAAGTDLQILTITISPAPVIPVITSVDSVNGQVGTPFAYQITATNSPLSFSASGLSLAKGLTLNSSGLISGTPTAFGVFVVTVTASNASGISNPVDVTFVINQSDGSAPIPYIVSSEFAAGTNGLPFTYVIDALGNPSDYEVVGLSAIPGLSLVGNTIIGTPTVQGSFVVELVASNITGSGTLYLQIDIGGGVSSLPPTVVFNEPSVGQVFELGDTIVVQVEAKDPDGFINLVQISEPTLAGTAQTMSRIGVSDVYEISFTPTAADRVSAAGTFNFTVAATDNSGLPGSNVVTVYMPPPGAPNLVVNAPVQDEIYGIGDNILLDVTATDSDGSITQVSVVESTLAGAGVNLSRVGSTSVFQISFTPTTAQRNTASGRFSFSITATDNSGATTTKVVSVIMPSPNAPIVQITAPAANDTYTVGDLISVIVSAESGDPGAVLNSVQIFDGNVLMGTAQPSGNVNEFILNYTTSQSDVGILTLSAVATDSFGVSASSPSRNITVVTGDVPTSTIIAPTTGDSVFVSEPFIISVLAEDTDGEISTVEVFNFNNRDPNTGLIVPLSLGFASPTATDGVYALSYTATGAARFVLRAIVTDDDFNQTTSNPVNVGVTLGSVPDVTINTPVDNFSVEVSDTLSINITAFDIDGTIAQVDVYSGVTLLGTASLVGSNTYRLDFIASLAGLVNLRAEATDDRGNVGISNIVPGTITQGTIPAITLAQPDEPPAGFILGETAVLTFTATDADGFITAVNVYQNNVLLATATPIGGNQYRYLLPLSTTGTFNYTGYAVDNRGNISISNVVQLSVESGAVPEVAIISPTANSQFPVNGTVSVDVQVTDSDGSIAQVLIYNGTVLLGEANLTTTSDVYRLNYVPQISGLLNLQATALDDRGNIGRSLNVPISAVRGIVPEGQIIAPGTGSQQFVNEPFLFKVQATDADGSITSVQLIDLNGVNGIAPHSLGFASASATPDEYVLQFTSGNTGLMNVQATLTDDRGNQVVIPTIFVSITSGTVPNCDILTVNGEDATGALTPIQIQDPVTIAIAANDLDGTVQTVEVLTGTTSLGFANRTGTGTYSFTYTPTLPGSVTYRAQATDDRGNVGVSQNAGPLSITAGSLPVAVITSPTAGTDFSVGDSFIIDVLATDLDGFIGSVEILNRTTSLGFASRVGTTDTFRFSYTPTASDVGLFNLQASVTDSRGNISTSAVVSVDVIPPNSPIVNIISPVGTTSVTVGIPVDISAIASVSSGNITAVNLYINGLLTQTSASTSPVFTQTFTNSGVNTVYVEAISSLGSVGISSYSTIIAQSETPQTSNVGFITQTFIDIFYRAPTQAELDDGEAILDSGVTRGAYVASLLDTVAEEAAIVEMMSIYRMMIADWNDYDGWVQEYSTFNSYLLPWDYLATLWPTFRTNNPQLTFPIVAVDISVNELYTTPDGINEANFFNVLYVNKYGSYPSVPIYSQNVMALLFYEDGYSLGGGGYIMMSVFASVSNAASPVSFGPSGLPVSEPLLLPASVNSGGYGVELPIVTFERRVKINQLIAGLLRRDPTDQEVTSAARTKGFTFASYIQGLLDSTEYQDRFTESFTLAVDSDANGSVVVVPNQFDPTDPTVYRYVDGTVVSLTATPNAGYLFDGWVGDNSSTDNPLLYTMSADSILYATFSAAATTSSAVSSLMGVSGVPLPETDLWLDYDGDGYRNIEEFAFGTDATKKHSSPVFDISVNGDTFTVDYVMLSDGLPPDMQIILECSGTMRQGDWHAIDASEITTDGVTQDGVPAGYQRVRVTLDVGDTNCSFVRGRVVITE